MEKVSQWAYAFGQLALYYQDEGGEPGRLLFAASGTLTDAVANRRPDIERVVFEEIYSLVSMFC